MGKFGISLLFVFLSLQNSSSAPSQHKFALVIGNSNYSSAISPLSNPGIDTDLVANALQADGFQVTILKNATRIQILTATSAYSHRLGETPDDVIGFFYYSGHGVARPSDGGNYLIPTDVANLSSPEAWFNSVALDDILKELQNNAPNATHFVIFDACREVLRMPTKAISKGFDGVADRTGMFIGFATSPQATASDIGARGGPYATALAAALREPGLDHLALFQTVKEKVYEATAAAGHPQRPWESNGLLRRVYLNASERPASSQNTNQGPNNGSKASSGQSSKVTPAFSIKGVASSFCNDLKAIVSFSGQDFLAIRRGPGTESGWSTDARLYGFQGCSVSKGRQTTFGCQGQETTHDQGFIELTGLAKKVEMCLGPAWIINRFSDSVGFNDLGSGYSVIASLFPGLTIDSKKPYSLHIMAYQNKRDDEIILPEITAPTKPDEYCDNLKLAIASGDDQFSSIKGTKSVNSQWFNSKIGLPGWADCTIDELDKGQNYLSCEIGPFPTAVAAETMADEVSKDIKDRCLPANWTLSRRRGFRSELHIEIKPVGGGANVEIRTRSISGKKTWGLKLDVNGPD